MKNMMSDETPASSQSQPRIYKNKSATGKDISVESSSSLPEGVQQPHLLYTLPVTAKCVGDGDGFTAYVDGAEDEPQQVHEALRAWLATGRRSSQQNNETIMGPPLASVVQDAEYKVVNGPNNQEILARKYRIRMRGIDAPELKMEYGMKAKNELVNLIAGKRVKIYVYGMDQHGRYIGDIYCGDMFIQEQMLKRGFAWHYKFFDKRPEFGQWEEEARDARRGLWRSDHPKKPWEWRNEQRNAEKQDVIIQVGNGIPRMIKEKKKKNSDEKAKEWEKKWASAVAENQMLNDRLRKSEEALSRMIEEKKNSEEKATEREKKLEISAVAENQMLNEEKACKQRVKRMAIWVIGTSMLTVGIAVLCNKWPKMNGATLQSRYTRTRI